MIKVIFLANALSAWCDNKVWAREQTDWLLFPLCSFTSHRLFSQTHRYFNCNCILSLITRLFFAVSFAVLLQSLLVKETICVRALSCPHPLLSVPLPFATSTSFSVGREKVLEKCCKIIHALYLLLFFTPTQKSQSGQSCCDFSLDFFLSCKSYFTTLSVMHWNLHSAKAKDLWTPFHKDLFQVSQHFFNCLTPNTVEVLHTTHSHVTPFSCPQRCSIWDLLFFYTCRERDVSVSQNQVILDSQELY